MNPYVETSESRCILGPHRSILSEEVEDAILRFNLNFAAGRTEVECSKNINSLHIFSSKSQVDSILAKKNSGALSDSKIFPVKQPPPRAKRQAPNNTTTISGCKNAESIKLQKVVDKDGNIQYNTSFVIYISNEKEEGLYSLYFHNCHNYDHSAEPKVHVR